VQLLKYTGLTIAMSKECTMQAKNWICAWVQRRISLRLNGRRFNKNVGTLNA